MIGRLIKQLGGLKNNEARLFGAIEADAHACHLLSIERGLHNGTNLPVNVFKLRSTTTIKGRVLQLWHITSSLPGADEKAIDHSLAHVKWLVEHLNKANP